MSKSIDRYSVILSVIIAALIPFPLIISGFVSVYGKADAFCFQFGIASGILGWALGQLFGFILIKAENLSSQKKYADFRGKSAAIKEENRRKAVALQDILTQSGANLTEKVCAEIVKAYSENKRKPALYLVRCGLWVSCGVLVILSEIYLFVLGVQSLALMFAPAAIILWCWFGFRFGSRQETMPVAMLGIYCVEAVLTYPISSSMEEKSNIGSVTILIITAVITVCAVLLFNRRQLNNLSRMGKGRDRLITKATLRFNTKTALIFSGMILFMFLFAGFGAKWLWEGVKAVVLFILYLLSRNPLEEGEDDTIHWSKLDELIKYGYDTTLFWYSVVAIAVILIVILLRKPIAEFIRELIENFKKKFGKPAAQNEEAHYTDVYRSTETQSYRKNTFKKAVRAFKREKEPTQKFRLGYKAFMIRIDEKSEKNVPSDTTRVHLEKGRRITDFEDLEKVVEAYCGIRYGGAAASEEECEMIGRLVEKI